jgi:A2L zinc ribbon domain
MEDTTATATPQNLMSKPCSACGGRMEFWATKQKLECNFCGHTEAVEVGNDQLVERDFAQGLQVREADLTGLGVQRKQIACRTCGAHSTIPMDAVTTTCEFCGANTVNDEAYDTRTIKPQGVIPFAVEQKTALTTFREWIGSGFFRPRGLKKVTNVDTIRPVYVPFWTYDAKTQSDWQAESGYHYYVTESYTDQSGQSQTRQVQRTRWEYSSGNHTDAFDDVTVIASKGITQARVERIYPYQLDKLVNFAPEFILGKTAEVYALDLAKGYDVAQDIMDKHIRSKIVSKIPGDTYRNLNINTQRWDVTYKHVLLPIWIAAYLYKEKSYQVVVNGQTGSISGEKPWDWLKIIITIVLAVGLIVGGYFLVKYFNAKG